MDWRDHKPHLNTQLMRYLVSGVGLRQSARMLKLSRRCTELKARKLARHLRRFNLNVRGQFDSRARLQFDELETFETNRRNSPLTLAVLIEAKSRFIIWGESATLSPRGRRTPARKRAIAASEARFGKRRNRSRVAVRRTLARARSMVSELEFVVVDTDKKSSYPGQLREAFGRERLLHSRTSSREPRTVANPLFPINQTEAIGRDLLGRLRRESWLASKKRRYLDLGFQMLMAWRNYVRPRFNRDHRTPAEIAGFARRGVRVEELLGWRQDWAGRSLSPFSSGSTSG
jgi:hypothetical protein